MKIVLVSLISVFIVACSSAEDEGAKVSSGFKAHVADTIPVFESSFVLVQNDTVRDMLSQLKICTQEFDTTGLKSCDSGNFRVLPLGPNIPWMEGFLLEKQKKVYSNFREVIAVRRVNGKPLIINRYRGVVLEQRTTSLGEYDALIGYVDEYRNEITVLHSWVDGQFIPKHVDDINGAYIAPEDQDSIDEVFLTVFEWGG